MSDDEKGETGDKDGKGQGNLILARLCGDELACVYRWLDIVGMDAMACTCKAARAAFTETMYRMVAIMQWGEEFWKMALTRHTFKVFTGMRQELARLHVLRTQCELHCIPMWTADDFRAFWKYEEEYCLRKRCRVSRER